MKKWNIVYMHTHDSGRYWSPYGYALPTPNLMDFARESTLFRHCYCAGPTCSPSRAALLTGRSPHACGMMGLAHRGWQLHDYSQHLAAFLNRQGYHTALCGIQHEAPDAGMIGYKEILGSQAFDMGATEQSMEKWDESNTDAACRFLGESEKGGEPFFLSMGWFNTHREFPAAKSDIRPDYLAVPLPLYDCDNNRKDMAGYHESVRVVDRCVGEMMDALRKNHLLDHTIVLMTTDHGIAFPRMKCNLYDTGIGVGLMVRFPGNPLAGRATDALVSQLDLFPTLCEMIGVDQPAWLEGTSMMPLFEGKSASIRDEIFSEVTYHASYEPMRCIRTERYKLIRFFDFHNGIVPSNIDDSLSKDFLFQNGFRQTVRDREYLFDLCLDPYERENVAGRQEYHDIYNALSTRLGKWMEKTSDPLLYSGIRVPKPAGARVNTLLCESPRIPDFEE